MDDLRRQKARKIFDCFDRSRDGRLSKAEMAELVVSVNPRVKFSSPQIDSILEEVFRTYAEFIHGSGGLSFEGLMQTYRDGAGDIDRDFETLKLRLDGDGYGYGDGDGDGEGYGDGYGEGNVRDEPKKGLEEEHKKGSEAEKGSYGEHKVSSIFSVSVSSVVEEAASSAMAPPRTSLFSRRTEHMPSWALSNIGYDSTWLLVEDLVIIIKRLEARMARNSRSQGFSETFSSSSDMVPWSADFKPNQQPWESLGNDYAIFQRELSDITRRAGESASSDEAFDAHLAVGWTLCDHFLLDQALSSLKKAHEIKPRDPRPLFHLGNAFYSAGSYAKAMEHYDLALSNGSFAEMENARIRPLLHVNMGIVLEAEGLLLNACEQYEKALSFAPKHPRALKLLGSCLYGVGEYRRAEKVLTEAIDASPGFADAHCDLASALHAIGEDDERAICEFQKALDLKPDHVDALYNFAGLFKDMGRYQRAAEMYSKVLVLQPNNWRAQLNRGVVLLGAGEAEESRKAFKEAFKLTNRVELYDAIEHLRLSKKAQRKHSGKASSSVSGEVKDQATGGGGRRRRRRRRRRRNEEAGESSEAMIRVDPSQFRRANERTTPSKWLVNALAIRQFQLRTRLHRCDVGRVQDEFFSAKCSGSKPSIEKVLRRLLHFLTPSAFQGAVRAVNERILCVLDSGGAGGEGTVDVGMLLALVSPICAGSTEQRKKTAFDALVWRTADTESELREQEKKVEKKDGDELRRADVLLYMKLLHAIYLPKDGMSQAQEVHGGGEGPSLSFAEFVGIFDDHDWGFGLLNVLAKLESSDRVRQIGRACAACAYPITGPWFWEITDKFDLCSLCYSQGKLPASASPRQDSHYYCFKEYRSKFEAVKDRLSLSRSKSLNLS